ncbi:hypothetical protein ACTXT7_007984 [Hymenolepis weldensis]
MSTETDTKAQACSSLTSAGQLLQSGPSLSSSLSEALPTVYCYQHIKFRIISSSRGFLVFWISHFSLLSPFAVVY